MPDFEFGGFDDCCIFGLNFIFILLHFGMSLKSNLLVVLPLAIFGAIVFGIAIYNTICKNAFIDFFNC